MLSFFKRILDLSKNQRGHEIDPDEVLLDSSNLPHFDRDQFEGRLEKPISRSALYSVAGFFLVAIAMFVFQAGRLQLVHGGQYRERSEKNMLRPVPVFAGRGVISDRNGIELAWNAPGETDVARRMYATSSGLSHILGYVQYPSKDKNGFYYQDDFIGSDGVEKFYDDHLKGQSGSRLVEVDAMGKTVSENVVRSARPGENIVLSIDSRVQSALYDNIRDIAERVGFSGGAGVIMDVTTGEIIALTSYPEYSSQIMSDKHDSSAIKKLLSDTNLPFLDRAVDGLYTPGSIVKPYIALGALSEKIIDPSTVIVTTGSISIPNPYDSTKSTLFRDWKNLGPVDMREAIAMSSDVYFYTIGGGYKDQDGLGILNIDKYLRIFGFGSSTKGYFAGKSGTIPTPEWKKKTFDEDWYLGDTYHTAIGQYGFQVTPVQIIRAVAAIANGGSLLNPTVLKTDKADVGEVITSISQADYKVIREGMRMSAEIGTGKALNVPFTKIAAKSGTAELGVSKDKVNSWITGFWPYDKPKYAFTVMLERGSVHNLIGAAAAFRQQLDWMNLHTPEYFE